jgi:hypothetical protein
VLAHALRFNGRKRVEHAGPFMAYLAAVHLREAMEGAGYVIMKTSDGAAPSITSHPYPGGCSHTLAAAAPSTAASGSSAGGEFDVLPVSCVASRPWRTTRETRCPSSDGLPDRGRRLGDFVGRYVMIRGIARTWQQPIVRTRQRTKTRTPRRSCDHRDGT